MLRNLKIGAHSCQTFMKDPSSNDNSFSVSLQDENQAICCVNGYQLYLIQKQNNESGFSSTLICRNIQDQTGEPIKFIQMLDVVSFIAASNKILFLIEIVEEDNASCLNIKEFVELDECIKCFEWNPDLTMGVVITEKAKLYLITMDLQLITEIDLNDESSLPTAKYVNVGWGSKSTQFHGTEGKMAAQVKQQFNPSRHNIQSYTDDDLRPYVSWEFGSGDCFAVNWVSNNPRIHGFGDGDYKNIAYRSMKLFTKEGELYSVGEFVPQMSRGCSWRPNTHLVATTQCNNDRGHCQVIFFERNGLRHNEFIVEYNNKTAATDKSIVIVDQLKFADNGDWLALSLKLDDSNVKERQSCNHTVKSKP